ncbi:hypothetical protein [Pseudotabrizicola algicola]|uniref:Uncharacterized protein n=1 Tax=Pseudotabrizicola algicola TaxID=2709381 RepID=A0A6B3RES0_9RHOB|nr:hypothetical protein [Pseudotabrizicola algicola]NEX44604.1 hypothetical protein [Pseudotabrizicola algicola]
MASAQALLKRVAKLEAARNPRPSPIAAIYGSTEAFAAECMAEVEAGKLCGTDMPVLLDCLRRWDSEGSWDVRRATGNGVWRR